MDLDLQKGTAKSILRAIITHLSKFKFHCRTLIIITDGEQQLKFKDFRRSRVVRVNVDTFHGIKYSIKVIITFN